jgi:MFS family permease
MRCGTGHCCDLDHEPGERFALVFSLMSTVASLPFFFFTLPAGALADMVGRKRMMFIM